MQKITILVILILLLSKLSLNGNELKILKPFSDPTAKQLASWLNEAKSMLSCVDSIYSIF